MTRSPSKGSRYLAPVFSAALVLAQFYSSGAEEAGCGAVAEYGVRLCNAPRAPQTCSLVQLFGISEGSSLCVWQEKCMRCVPRPGFLNVSACDVAGLAFKRDGSCPSPQDSSICADCGGLRRQELCIGLCSEVCTWANVSRFGGDLCSLRVPVVEPDDPTMLIVLASVGGAAGLALLVFLCRALMRLRAKAIEEAEAQRIAQLMQRKQSRHSAASRGSGASATARQRASRRAAGLHSSEGSWERQTSSGSEAKSGIDSSSLGEASRGIDSSSLGGAGRGGGRSSLGGAGRGGSRSGDESSEAEGSSAHGGTSDERGGSDDAADRGSRWRRDVEESEAGVKRRGPSSGDKKKEVE